MGGDCGERLNVLKGPEAYRGPLALKKLYNKHKGVKGAASPPLRRNLLKV